MRNLGCNLIFLDSAIVFRGARLRLNRRRTMKYEPEEPKKQIEYLRKEICCLRELLESREIEIKQLETMKYNAELECERLKSKVEAYEYCIGGRP